MFDPVFPLNKCRCTSFQVCWLSFLRKKCWLKSLFEKCRNIFLKKMLKHFAINNYIRWAGGKNNS
jgi:hypothetical protein